MERILDPSGVTFDAAARTLTFTGTVPLSLAHILRVVNLTRGEFYFDSTGNNGQGLTQSATYASPVLTLHHRLDGAENTDTLAVLYDDGSAGGGGGGGGGDASAALQTQQLTELQTINADIGVPADPAATSDVGTFGLIALIKRWLTRNGTREYSWANGIRQAIASTSSTAVAIPAVGASREVMFHASSRCFIRLGDSGVTDATIGAGQLVVEAGERFHFRLASGETHFKVIRDTADGFLNVVGVVG